MTVLPSFILLFDLSAVLAGNTRQWQEYSRVGDCWVPQDVLEELKELCDHASEPGIEPIAREFQRFYPTSGWQSTHANATHPALQAAASHTLSRKARLALTVLQCAYGVSKQRTDALVVLVANNQPLLQQLLALEATNLCGVPLPAFVQWTRTLRRPAVVSHHLQLMRQAVSVSSSSAPPHTGPTKAVPRPATSRPAPTAAPVARAARPTPMLRSHRWQPLVYNLVSLVLLAAIGLTGWRVLHPPSFSRFWQQLPFTSASPSTPTAPRR